MPAPKILIASSKHDGLNYGQTADYLTQYGCEVVLFEPDSIADGSREFSMRIQPNGAVRMTYGGQPFELDSFGAAWHRRPNYFGEHPDPLRWLSLKDEYSSLMKTVAQLIPAKKWLNTAQNMIIAGQKLPQLKKAAEHGFLIPETTIGNKWPAIELMPDERLIVKYAELTVLYPKNHRKTLPTTIFDKRSLPKEVAPYPGIWQPYHPKQKEWRITVVGDKVFPVAIYSDEAAKDDWRIHQDTPRITFRAETFPEDLQRKCRTFLKSLDLRYGAFDFIERPDGKIVFLEVNPNGQFMWLEQKLDLPISKAIADELLAIASTGN